MINWRGRGVVAVVLLAAAGLLIISEQPVLWGGITLLAAAVAAGEWAALSGFSKRSRVWYVVLFLVLALMGEFVLFADVSHRGLWVVVAFFWAFVAPWMLLRKWVGGNAIIVGALGMLLLYATWQAAKMLYKHDVYMLIVGMAAVWLFDSAAFFVGRLIGRTPLSPEISPKKTIEGFLGGLSVVVMVAVFFQIPIGGREYSPALLLAVVIALSMLATVGDLFESSLKRKAGVKDSGVLLGAHGGVLDRLDAMLPVLPFVALLSPWL